MSNSLEHAKGSVSVGIPVHNEEKFIKETLDNLLVNYDEISEIIISDNASSDKTEEICKDYVNQFSKIKYFKHPTPINAYENFNFLINKASSEFFFFMRAKNRISDNFIKNCKDRLQNSESADIAIPIYYKYNEEISQNCEILYDPSKYSIADKDIKKRFIDVIRFPINCMMIYGFYRLNFLKNEFCKLDFCESASDNILSYKIVLKNPVALVKNAFVNHFVRYESIETLLDRYASMGFSVDRTNPFWYLPIEAAKLCRLYEPNLYKSIKNEFRPSFNLSLRAYLFEKDLFLTMSKGRYVQHILNKAKDKKVVFWGTSKCAEIVHSCLKDRLHPSLYVDNNKSKQGAFFHEIKIVSPIKIKDSSKFVCVVNVDESNFIWEIYNQLSDMGYIYMTNMFFLAREVSFKNI